MESLSTGVRRKAEIVDELATRLGVQAPPMSTGSTEPKQIFTIVNDQLGLGLNPRGGKPALARGIVEAAGGRWEADYESRGSTITRQGLEAVAAAVRSLVER